MSKTLKFQPVRVILTIEALIQPNGETLEVIRERFAHIANAASLDGCMTGDGPAEIVAWDAYVIDRPGNLPNR